MVRSTNAYVTESARSSSVRGERLWYESERSTLKTMVIYNPYSVICIYKNTCVLKKSTRLLTESYWLRNYVGTWEVVRAS